ncbi:nitroreductase [Pasteurellaceae bacterium 15-036681]|nr:nitroreductase [Pasteurellaceae bacterium 15-036681]
MNTLADALDLLQHRRSSKKFGNIAPNQQQLDVILKAGLRAPDHGRLKPYHFVVIGQNGMEKFHNYLTQAAQELGLGEDGIAKATKLSQRAPMVIGVVAKIEKDIPKVPAWEQMLTAGCATYAMQLAANAQGFETCWITNKWINGSALREAFGCREFDKVVALVLVGSPLDSDEITTASQTEEIGDFVSYIE